MALEEMNRKIQNAFNSVGNEEGSIPRFPGIEFSAVTVKFQDVISSDGHAPIIDWSPANQVTQMLNAGWLMGRSVVCPPFVMFIFHRVKEETEEK